MTIYGLYDSEELMTRAIKLERFSWSFDETARLGPPGGFGEVFRGKGNGDEVAVKRLKLTAGAAAHREMKLGKALADRTLKHVVPVLDYGQDAETDRYYLVMPLCGQSLQDKLLSNGPLEWNEARAIALDIIAGLLEVSDIVHRDLKPGNVLWDDGNWRVADFGIAKFVEDSTSLETLRQSLTPPYGAPEQWLGEAPTRATDVYALGCIVHAMINGQPPFVGDIESIRKAHLEDQPPALRTADPRLGGLVQFMLRKSAASRPSLDRCKSVIESTAEQMQRTASRALSEAGQAIAQRESEADALRQSAEAARRSRASMAKEASIELDAIVKRLFDEIQSSSESVRRHERAIVMGPAHMIYSGSEALPLPVAPQVRRHESGWDVAAFSKLSIRATIERQSYSDPPVYTFEATIAFCRTKDDANYRWRELSFFNWGRSQSMDSSPIALSPIDDTFGIALSNVVSGWQLAHGPWMIDAEDEQRFQDRWITLFAKAATNRLRPPSRLPLEDGFFR